MGIDSLILKGAYKNDLKTREFMKSIVGDNFHFTVSSMNWIKDRWRNGNPPTYKEYREFWINDRKNYQGLNLDTLQYNKFIKTHKNKGLIHNEIINLWNIERNKRVEYVIKTIFKEKII